ncbi:type I glyceraldehyde-3-phosphate dehydrogenase [Deminuibacter soli]|uniref:Aldehyde dehydrogenase n=1 Tax=Deminuibacter soli TaxID=2291815 RepID=A0A3E1NGT9_9BACT|nr:type I glyceraldehyde-3-phosphate dehydrogenase [Deminuibacter soli]RFM27170.1 aldehyde dehydrogenase [Deminuibacter soli]
MRVAINGMGRIGRLLCRKLLQHPTIELVAVNDVMDTDNLVYLLKYDSVYGTLADEMQHTGDTLVINGKTIRATRFGHPSQLPWKELQVDVVLECSGKFTTRDAAGTHLQSGAGKVLLSTTGAPDIPLLIYGFNQHALTKDINIISPGGCMTNCSIHILYLLQSIGIEAAQVNILHSYTSRQALVDAPAKQFRRGRAAAEAIIPVEIDLAVSLQRLFPTIPAIATMSTRVPVANGAMADFTVQLKHEASAAEINKLFETAAKHEFKGVVGYTTDPLVSLDVRGNTHSCLIDGALTSSAGKLIKLIAWFDNESGYTSRMVDWLELIGRL